MTPTLALTATLWHTLALSGSLLLSNFAYTALDQLTGPLLGSQRRCHNDALSPALYLEYYGIFRNDLKTHTRGHTDTTQLGKTKYKQQFSQVLIK